MPEHIIFPEKGRVALETYTAAIPEAHQVRVRTLYSLMSIGTETIILHQKYDPDTHFARMFSFPQLKTGVQAVGEIEIVGSEVNEFQVGDIIFMRQAHGSHQVLSAADCSFIPKDIDLKSACWSGLAKTAFRAAWAGDFKTAEQVLIIGAGPVGQMTLRWAHSEKVECIGIADIASKRIKHAKRGGATMLFAENIENCLDSIQSMNAGKGPDVVVDTTGNAAVFQHALSAAGMFAKVILLGDSGYPSKQGLSSAVMSKGLTIQATHDSHDRDGWTQRRIDALFLERVAAGTFDLSGLITHEFLPEQCEQAYLQAEEGRHDCMGILYDWTTKEY